MFNSESKQTTLNRKFKTKLFCSNLDLNQSKNEMEGNSHLLASKNKQVKVRPELYDK